MIATPGSSGTTANRASCSLAAMRKISTAVIAALLAVGLVSCATGDGGTVEADVWTQQADELCAFSQAEADAALPVTGAGSPVPPVRARADLARLRAEALRDLGLPEGNAKQAKALADALDAQAESLDALADALLADPAASAGPAGAAATVANDRVTEAASELGVPSCSALASTSDSSTPGDAETFDPGVSDSQGGGGFVQE